MIVKRFLYLLYLVLICTFASSMLAANKKVIIDTDCDMDDMMAVLYLLKAPDADVVAITTTGAGVTHWKYSAPNILKLIQQAGQPNIPVSFGAKKSLTRYANFPEKWRVAVDRFIGIKMPENPNPPSKLESWELITKEIQTSNEKVSILALGPLTNIAIALKKDPTLVENISKIVISGGALNVAGNIYGAPRGFKNDCAEYNIFLDTKAAQIIFNSGAFVEIVPLDATQQAPLTLKIYERFDEVKRNPSVDFVVDVTRPYIVTMNDSDLYFWDPVAAVVMMHPEIATFEMAHLKVNQNPGSHYGCLEESKKAPLIRACTSIDSEAFYNIFFKTLSQSR